MKVKIKNDKKEKRQSVEAIIEIDFNHHKGFEEDIFGDVQLVGYGYTEDEALQNLTKVILAFRKRVADIDWSFEIEP